MNTIKIDTSNNLVTKIELVKDDKTFKLEENRKTPGEQNVLELIERLIKNQGTGLKDIDKVEIVEGPGSFTGLRVGASIANALSFGVHITVNDKPLGEIVEPIY